VREILNGIFYVANGRRCPKTCRRRSKTIALTGGRKRGNLIRANAGRSSHPPSTAWGNQMRAMKYLQCAAMGAVAVAAAGVATGSYADSIPPGWEAHNMEPIGYSGLNNRKGAFKMAIKKVNGLWYLYMGHLWHYGWSIVDVTDPRNPKFVKTVPGPGNTWTIQMTLHDNIMVTALEKSSLAWGADPNKPNEEGVLIWDISDPINPRQLSHWKTGASGTHRNSYPGGKYVYLSAGAPGFSSNILVILDISDPARPREAGRWWMPGQKAGEPKGQGRRAFMDRPASAQTARWPRWLIPRRRSISISATSPTQS
jgi:LVIVD repeat